MTHTLEQRLATVQAKLKAEKKETPNETFFQKQRKRILSGEAETEYQAAIALGAARANIFQTSVMDATHPEHSANVRTLNKSFGNDLAQAMNSIIKNTCVELDSPNPEELKEDPQYENAVNEKFRPKGNISPLQLSYFNILQDNLKKSRDARGYGLNRSYDEAVIQDWMDKYQPK